VLRVEGHACDARNALRAAVLRVRRLAEPLGSDRLCMPDWFTRSERPKLLAPRAAIRISSANI
jgi:hypothetical protein